MTQQKDEVQSGPSTPVATRHNFSPIGNHATDALLSSAKPLVPEPHATKVMLQALAQNIRYTLEGSTPLVGTVGFLLLTGDAPIIIEIERSTTITVIEETATAILQFQWGK